MTRGTLTATIPATTDKPAQTFRLTKGAVRLMNKISEGNNFLTDKNQELTAILVNEGLAFTLPYTGATLIGLTLVGQLVHTKLANKI